MSMRKHATLWALLLALATGLAGCMEAGDDGNGDDGVGTGTDGDADGDAGGDGAGRSADDPASGTLEIAMEDLAFQPEEVWVEAGTEVTWVNEGNVVHTATAEDDAWDSGDVAPGGEYSETFDETGDHPYVCIYHEAQGMVGTIHVVS